MSRARWAGVAVVAIAWSQFAWLSPTNFLGYDEWLILSLTSRGIVSYPYANRPLAGIWNLPAALAPDPLLAHWILHWTYLAVTGVLVFALVRRLAPGCEPLAFLAGVFAATWAPGDLLRLDSVQMLLYSGFMVGLLAALWLLVEGWRRGAWSFFAAASALAFVTARAYEGVFPLLFGAPLVLTLLARPRPRWSWALGWYGALVAAAVQMAAGAPAASRYQAGFETDLHPLRMAARLAQHYGFELRPLVATPVKVLAAPSAALSAFLLVVILIALFRRELRGPDRGPAAMAIAVGLVLAGLGFAAFLPVPDLTAPLRTQFLPAPGVAVLLAGCVLWLASWAPPRLKPFAAAALAGWVMWVGTACVHAMQRHWDMRSLYARQAHLLRELTRLAPGFVPGTLVVLVDRTDAWRPFAFQHAVEYMYEGRATGHLAGPRENVLVPTHLTDDGVVREPIAAIRGPWRSPATLHRYDQVVVVRYAADGAVAVLDEWPRRLRELPPGASYAPRARIVPGGPEPRSRAVLP